VQLEIVPEPSGEEREAITAALEKARSQSDRRDEWWRAGVVANLEEDAGEGLSPAGD
jgi:hypothetical protein